MRWTADRPDPIAKSPVVRCEGDRQLRPHIYIIGLAALVPAPAWCAPSFLSGAGPVSAATSALFWIVLGAMSIVVLPVLLLTPAIAWRYRLRAKARYEPEWRGPRWLDAVVWGVPVMIVLGLSVVAWRATHRLDPYRAISANQPPLDVEVVGMDWKWLFLYPGQGIASVNVIVVPAGRPLRLHLTSATVMQSLMVPSLGGQIYAMAGMTTQLNLLASQPGRYFGQNTQFNGPGFPKQRFQLLAVSPAAYDRFIARAQASPRRWDAAQYALLSRQSSVDTPLVYAAVPPGLFQRFLQESTRRKVAQ